MIVEPDADDLWLEKFKRRRTASKQNLPETPHGDGVARHDGEEIDLTDIAQVILDEKMRLAREDLAPKPDFKVDPRCDEWTARMKRKTVIDSWRGEAKSEVAVDLLVLVQLQSSCTNAKKEHGRRAATILCREWCRRMQFYLDAFFENDYNEYMDWTLPHLQPPESEEFMALARDVVNQSTLARIRKLRSLVPRPLNKQNCAKHIRRSIALPRSDAPIFPSRRQPHYPFSLHPSSSSHSPPGSSQDPSRTPSPERFQTERFERVRFRGILEIPGIEPRLQNGLPILVRRRGT